MPTSSYCLKCCSVVDCRRQLSLELLKPRIPVVAELTPGRIAPFSGSERETSG
jgi:hypothetical protein